jgi:hypothetical protein
MRLPFGRWLLCLWWSWLFCFGLTRRTWLEALIFRAGAFDEFGLLRRENKTVFIFEFFYALLKCPVARRVTCENVWDAGLVIFRKFWTRDSRRRQTETGTQEADSNFGEQGCVSNPTTPRISLGAGRQSIPEDSVRQSGRSGPNVAFLHEGCHNWNWRLGK